MSLSVGLIGLVAIYAAAVSTYLLVTERITRRPRLAVKVSLGFLGQGAQADKPMLIVSVSNAGKNQATLTSMGLRLADQRNLVFLKPNGDSSLPHTLAPGKSTRLWVSASRVSQMLKECGVSGSAKVAGFFADELERVYRSRWCLFDASAYDGATVHEPATVETVTEPESSERPRPTFSW